MNLSISEAAEKVGVSTYTLRYYEKEEIIPEVPRNSSGHRVYREEDIEWINFVNCLKSTGMPISEIKKFVKLCEQGDSTIGDRIAIMVAHRKRILSRMARMEEFLEKINWKIDYYEGLREELSK